MDRVEAAMVEVEELEEGLSECVCVCVCVCVCEVLRLLALYSSSVLCVWLTTPSLPDWYLEPHDLSLVPVFVWFYEISLSS